MEVEGQQSLDLERLQRATVYIIQADGPALTTRCVGSGTIVRPDGLILTNAHNTVRSATCPGDTLIIAMTLNVGEAPIPKYRAEIVQFDNGLDLALLRITQELDGRQLDRGALPLLPFVEVGSADDVGLDETLTIVGYTGIGNDAARGIRATVRGLLAEPSGGERSWIKIGGVEPLFGVMSGGGAYNSLGQLVGIPTSAPLSVQAANTQCRYLEDTNGDRAVNMRDTCVPIGDFVSVLRPIDFARPLIRSASFGLQAEILTVPTTQQRVADRPRITRLFSAPSVVDGVPSTVVGSVAAGSTSLYLFFDYENMTAETVYELRVSIDGVPSQVFSLPPVRWSGGERGLWYIGSSGQPYPNGVYEYNIYVDGVSLAQHRIVVGGPPTQAKSFSNVVFGLLDELGNLQGNGYVLPTGTIATARFIYQGMTPGTPYTVLWYFNGSAIARADSQWSAQDGENGSYSVSLQPEGGLIPGSYRLELYLEGLLSATGDFVIAGERVSAVPQVFLNLNFVRANNLVDLPMGNPASSYPDGANVLYGRFDWRQIAPGTSWRLEWLVDDSPFYIFSSTWVAAESGQQFSTRLSSTGRLPDATYSIRLFVNDILLATNSVTVGIGQLALDRFTTTGGVQLRGRIIDAVTRQGIPGVAFILITEDFSVADFVWDTSQIYALAITDRNGRFEVDRSLELGSPYSVIVEVEGYLPLAVDSFQLSPEDGNPVDMLIELVRG
ncbi:MAG: trypsin-like peptidase domain-containing protein [Anaerolineae bacterium]|nr:trypsin-like peptidase domain-containing protein [Anaerolineae bacterium]